MWPHKSFVHIVINTGLGKVFCNFRHSPIVLFTLVVITFKCYSKVNLSIKKYAKVFLMCGLRDNAVIKTKRRMGNFLSFSTKNNLLGNFAWVWVKYHFLLESPFLDLIQIII